MMTEPQPAAPNELEDSEAPSNILEDDSVSSVRSFSAIAEEFRSDPGAEAASRPPGLKGDSYVSITISVESDQSTGLLLAYTLPSATTAKIPPPSTKKLSKSPSGPSAEIAFLEA